MGFDQSTILSVSPPVAAAGQLHLTWTTSAPAGTYFQVYVNRRLTWYGRGTSASFPAPSGKAHFDVGSVGAGEAATDFSGSLPSAPDDRALLTWRGGTSLGPDLAGYRVYGSASAGSAVDYSRPLATLAAYEAGIVTDGFGLGGFGEGGFGSADDARGWTSGPLASGTWTFGVVPFDSAGNAGTAREASVAITAAPRPPARDAAGLRLTYSYDSGTRVVTLGWLASPDEVASSGLSGTAAATSAATASLAAVQSLAGTSAADSAAPASIAVDAAFAGTAATTSAATADITDGSGISGTAAATSTATADMATIAASSGTAAATSTATASLATAAAAGGTASAGSSATAGLASYAAFAGVAAATSTATADLDQSVTVQGGVMTIGLASTRYVTQGYRAGSAISVGGVLTGGLGTGLLATQGYTPAAEAAGQGFDLLGVI